MPLLDLCGEGFSVVTCMVRRRVWLRLKFASSENLNLVNWNSLLAALRSLTIYHRPSPSW